MVEAVLVILFPLVADGRPHLVSASGHSELGSGDRLLARLGEPKDVVVCFKLGLCPLVDGT